jgi:uncharacterized radical SAM superfamily Fe-S cluster-containing enzyme
VPSRLVEHTSALCPACDRVLPGRLVDRDADVHLELDCPEHGSRSSLYFRDTEFYESLAALKNDVECCSTFDCARGQPCTRRATSTMIYMVNVTNNCNMTCGACLSGSEMGKQEPYIPGRRLMAALPEARRLGFTPHVVFFGGEPTMHPELPEMVALAVERGFVPRLATNGLKLRDERFARQLAQAGLRWVFLHFDSLDDAKNERLRGRPMLEASNQAIATCRSAGMKVQLGTTVSRDNLGELSDLFAFAGSAGVFWVSLYPVAEIERPGSSGTTYLTDVVDAIAEQTNGQITRDDFVASSRIWSRMFRLTGRYNYRQKPTMLSLPAIIDGDRLVPFSRLANPRTAIRQPSALARLARALPSLLAYEQKPPTADTLIINIQQFQGRGAFDLREAVHTLMSYAHQGSFLPFDIFNHAHRYSAERALVPVDNLVRASE